MRARKAVDTKRTKKAKIKGQKLRFRCVDSNKSPKYVPKKQKSEPKKKTVDTVDKKRTKKAKIKGQNSCFNSVDNLNKKKV